MALVVLVKGINVGGHRRFRPARLAQQLGHVGAVNIGAAGTFVIRPRVSRARLRAEFARRLPVGSEIMICHGREIRRLLSQDFFSGHPVRPDMVRFASLLSRLPRTTPNLPLDLPSRRDWLVKVLARDGRFIVGLYRRRMAVIGQLGALDRVFGVPLTPRTWHTLAAIASGLEGGRTSPGARGRPLARAREA